MAMRWRVAVLVGAAIAISYLDRQALPVAVKAIEAEIPLTNTQFGELTSVFLLAYALMYAGGGVVVDRLGTRRGLLAIMIFWSLACASHSLAAGLRAARGQPLPARHGRGRRISGRDQGHRRMVSGRRALDGDGNRQRRHGGGSRRRATGHRAHPAARELALGVRRVRRRRASVGGLVVRQLPVGRREAPHAPAAPRMAWSRLLTYREVWGLVAAKFLTDAAWFFYISWLPKYLYDARHFDVKQVGAYAWVPYAASGVGCLLGGWFSSALVRRGRSIDVSRKLALGLSAAVMPVIVFVTHAPIEWALVIFSLAFFGQQSWSTLVMIVPTDLFEPRVVASVAGLVGFGGAMGGLLMNLAAGRLLDAGFTYETVFDIVGTLHVIAFVVILVAIPRIRAVEER